MPPPAPGSRAVRVPAVLGDGRRDRRPPRQDAPLDDRAVQRHPRQRRRPADDGPAATTDHRRRRPPDHRGGAPARPAGRARVHELRPGPQSEAAAGRGAPGRGHRVARQAWWAISASTASTWTSRRSTRSRSRPTAGSWASCGRRSSRPTPTTRSRWPHRATRWARPWRPARTKPVPIGSSSWPTTTGRERRRPARRPRSPGATATRRTCHGRWTCIPRWAIPPQKLLLGLPLYGVAWPVSGPEIGAPDTGRGASWILRNHLDLLTDPAAVPQRDGVESVEVYALGSDGSIGPPPSASPVASPGLRRAASPAASSAASRVGEASGRGVGQAVDVGLGAPGFQVAVGVAGRRSVAGGLRRLARDVGDEAGSRSAARPGR